MVTTMNLRFIFLWQGIKQFVDFFWLSEHYVSNDIHELKQLQSNARIIGNINLPRMHRIVTDDPNYIESFLNFLRKTILN